MIDGYPADSWPTPCSWPASKRRRAELSPLSAIGRYLLFEADVLLPRVPLVGQLNLALTCKAAAVILQRAADDSGWPWLHKLDRETLKATLRDPPFTADDVAMIMAHDGLLSRRLTACTVPVNLDRFVDECQHGAGSRSVLRWVGLLRQKAPVAQRDRAGVVQSSRGLIHHALATADSALKHNYRLRKRHMRGLTGLLPSVAKLALAARFIIRGREAVPDTTQSFDNYRPDHQDWPFINRASLRYLRDASIVELPGSVPVELLPEVVRVVLCERPKDLVVLALMADAADNPRESADLPPLHDVFWRTMALHASIEQLAEVYKCGLRMPAAFLADVCRRSEGPEVLSWLLLGGHLANFNDVAAPLLCSGHRRFVQRAMMAGHIDGWVVHCAAVDAGYTQLAEQTFTAAASLTGSRSRWMQTPPTIINDPFVTLLSLPAVCERLSTDALCVVLLVSKDAYFRVVHYGMGSSSWPWLHELDRADLATTMRRMTPDEATRVVCRDRLLAARIAGFPDAVCASLVASHAPSYTSGIRVLRRVGSASRVAVGSTPANNLMLAIACRQPSTIGFFAGKMNDQLDPIVLACATVRSSLARTTLNKLLGEDVSRWHSLLTRGMVRPLIQGAPVEHWPIIVNAIVFTRPAMLPVLLLATPTLSEGKRHAPLLPMILDAVAEHGHEPEFETLLKDGYRITSRMKRLICARKDCRQIFGWFVRRLPRFTLDDVCGSLIAAGQADCAIWAIKRGCLSPRAAHLAAVGARCTTLLYHTWSLLSVSSDPTR